jgi:hypothetical protein
VLTGASFTAVISSPLQRRGFVAGRAALEDDELGLQEGQQSLAAAFPADAGLLEAAERDAEVGAERVVPDGAGAQLPGDLASPVDVVGKYR